MPQELSTQNAEPHDLFSTIKALMALNRDDIGESYAHALQRLRQQNQISSQTAIESSRDATQKIGNLLAELNKVMGSPEQHVPESNEQSIEIEHTAQRLTGLNDDDLLQELQDLRQRDYQFVARVIHHLHGMTNKAAVRELVAKIIGHVCDIANDDMQPQLVKVERTLHQLLKHAGVRPPKDGPKGPIVRTMTLSQNAQTKDGEAQEVKKSSAPPKPKSPT